MHDPQDKKEFGEILNAVMVLYSKDATAILLRLYWKSLIEYPLDQVRRAFDHWVKDPKQGTFMPKPADIIRTIQEATGTLESQWLSANEAWAIALPAADEAATVVWTQEMAKAWVIAKPILDAGDKIGARMAFIPAYERFVDQSKRESRTPHYEISAGWDANMRELAVQNAVTAGLLPPPPQQTALPAPDRPVFHDDHVAAYRRHEMSERLKALSQQLKDQNQQQWKDRVNAHDEARQAHERRKAEVIREFNDYQEKGREMGT